MGSGRHPDPFVDMIGDMLLGGEPGEAVAPVAPGSSVALNPPPTTADTAAFFAAGNPAYGGGVKPDGQLIQDGAITSGQAVLTSATGYFKSTDVGKMIVVQAAGAAGVTLVTTVLSFQSATQVTLAANAGSTVSGKQVWWGTDNVAAITAVIAAIPVLTGLFSGGTIQMPLGRALSSGLMNLDNTQGFRVTGQGEITGGVAAGTELIYTGTAAPFISAKGARGWEFDHINVQYVNNQFTGTLIDLQRSGAADNQFTTMHDAIIGGGQQTSAAILISLSQVDEVMLRRVAFGGAVVSVQGVDTSVGVKFSNIVHIEDCNFGSTGSSYQIPAGGFGIQNPGQAWIINDCNFEARADGSAGAINSTAANHAIGNACVIEGCWFGDVTGAVAGTWITTPGNILGLSILGNYFSGIQTTTSAIATAAPFAGAGLVIKGNTFANLLTAVTIGNNTSDLDLVGNYYLNVTNRLVIGAGVIQSGMAISANNAIQFWGALASPGSVPPVASALGANVTSVTPAGTNIVGTLAIVMSGALAANTKIATLTWATSFGGTAPVVLLVNQTSGAGLAIVNFYGTPSTGVSVDLFSNQALAAGTYTVIYLAVGRA